MPEITRSTSLQELAAIISQTLERAGIIATLSGGSAVSIYSDNRYQSHDLDFVTSADPGRLGPVVATIGFVRSAGVRPHHRGCSPAGNLEDAMGAIARHHPDTVRHGPVGGLLPLERSPVLGSGTPRRPIPSRGLAATPDLGGVGRVTSSVLGTLPRGSPIHLIPGIVRLSGGATARTHHAAPARAPRQCV